MYRVKSWLSFSAPLLALMILPCALAQENTGTILGTVTDPSGAVVPGATVVATSDRLPRGLTTTTDNAGNYTLSRVPVGVYTLSVSKTGFSTIKQGNIEITIGSQFVANPKLEVGTTATIVEVAAAGASLDVTSSRTDTNITRSVFESLAKGRTFNTILALAPGVRTEVKGGSAGVGGIQVDGSSGLENTYYLDGVEVSDVLSGALRAANAVPLDFISDVQIRTGGFEAEHGGATGGVVNVAIRSGANAYHGAAFLEGTGGGLNASDRGYWQRSVADTKVAEFFKPKEDSYRILYPGGILGGSLVRDKLFFFAGYSPEREHSDRTVAYTSGARTFTQDKLRHYMVSRLDYAATNKLQLYGSYIWSPFTRNGTLPSRDARLAAPTNNLAIQGGYVPSQAVNTGMTFALTPRLILSARYGYKYLNDKDGNYGQPADPYVVYQTAAPAGVPTPGGTGFTNVSSTLTTFHDITTRHNVYIDGTFVTNLFGQSHTFKAGYAVNRIANDVVTDFTNGNFLIYWNNAFTRGSVTDKRGTYGYYTWEDGVRLNSAVHSRNQGFYIQDSWRAGKRVTLNLGVRFENEYLPPYKAESNGTKVANPVSFDWGSKIAPRLGAAWDMLGNGKWKLTGSFGYFFDVMKYNLARGSFGGEFWVTHVYTLDNPNVLTLSKANPGVLGTSIIAYDNRTIPINAQGVVDGTDPDLKPYKSRDFNVTFDHQIAPHLTASIRYNRKDLLSTIEDIGVLDKDDNEVYLIGNPGFGQTRNDVGTRLDPPQHTYDQKTPNGKEFLVPKAIRQYDGVEFRVQGKVHNLLLVPSYTYSRLWGNYSGLGNSDESGRSNPNNNRSFDLPYYYFDASGSQKNVFGILGTDRPHTFKMFASYDLKTKAGSTIFGVNELAFSGTPDSTSLIYLSAPTYPYGRGDMGRTPTYTQTDLFISHEIRLTERMHVKLSADIRNLFNQAALISRDSQINRTGAVSAALLPISQFFAGYDPKQFVFRGSLQGGKTLEYNSVYGLAGASYRNAGAPAVAGIVGSSGSAFAATNPNFGGYQDFRVIRLGARFTF